MRSTKRFPGFLLTLVVTMWLTTGCDAAAPPAAAAIEAAAGNAEDAKSARVEIVSRVMLEGEVEWEDRVSGVIDFDAQTSHILVDGGSYDWELITIAGKTYTRDAGQTTWYVEEYDGDTLFGGASWDANPEELLAAWLDVDADEFEQVGTETVRGVEATRYQATVEGDDDELESTSDAWIDAEGRPVKLTISGTMTLAGEELEFFYSMELFDYGTDVDIEAPPDDEVVEAPDIDLDPDDFDLDDPFGDAECWGERLEACVEPNPELAALAQDPALCQGETARVCLVPVGNVRKDVVEAIVAFHRDTAGIEVVVLPALPVPSAGIRTETSQVTENSIYNSVRMAYGVMDDTPSTYIAITPIDIVPEDDQYFWMFGARMGAGPFGNNHGVFSYFRMANVEPYSRAPLTDELLYERVAKYAARYTAILHLDYPYTEDNSYLNYFEMYGFSDLDSMGTTWPSGPVPCRGEGPIICIVPDNDWDNPRFQSDFEAVVARIDAELSVRVEVRTSTSYYPSKDSWSIEFHSDLSRMMRGYLAQPGVTVIGVTDDAFSQDRSVPPHIDAAWPEERIGVVSAHGAGKPGTEEHRERLYRLIIRGITRTHYGISLSQNGSSILSDAITTPEELDGRGMPELP